MKSTNVEFWPLLQVCIAAMAQCDCIGPIKTAMKLRRDQIGLACEAINKMFQTEQDELIEQVRKTSLHPVIYFGEKLIFLVHPSSASHQK